MKREFFAMLFSPLFQPSWRHFSQSLIFQSFRTGSRRIKALEWPNVDEWNSVLIQSKQLFESIWNPPKLNPQNAGTRFVVKRLQKCHMENEHLIRIFSNLSETTMSTAHWPGLVSIMFTRAAEEAMMDQTDNRIGHQQLALAEIINLLYSCLLFRTEYFKFLDSKNDAIYDKYAFRLINSYFISEALCKLKSIKNSQVLWLVAAMAESLAKINTNWQLTTRYQQTLTYWEDDVQNSQGILVANGCKAAMELANLSPGLKELGFQYGKFLTLAAKAHTDIQQFLDYQSSSSSYFSLNSLPVTLHLQKNPATLAYISNCEKPMDNLNFHTVYTAISSDSSLEDAYRKLAEYIQTTSIIIKEFTTSQLAANLLNLIVTLNKFGH